MTTAKPSRGGHAAGVLLLLVLVAAWFSPVLLGDRIFITDNYLGAFFLPLQPWSDLLNSGFPLYADLNFGNAYPLRIALSALAPVFGQASSYNAFVVAAYAIAALGTYLYVAELTGSVMASVVAGAAFAFSGFMQAHVGHETMTHSAAWLPLILWSTHRIVERREWRDAAFLALAAAAMYLANHPEIYLQVALVSGLYALWMGWRSPDRMRSVLLLAAGWAISVALVGWQLAGAAEYAAMSNRVATARVLTLHGALPIDQVAAFALPWVFGAPYPGAIAPLPLFGYSMAMETAAYVAAPVFILAMAGIASSWESSAARFWLFAAALFFVLALGPQTMLGQALFHAPGFRLFNIPGRNLLTVHFAFSVLCGLGVAALLARQPMAGKGAAIWVAGLLPTFAAAFSYPLVVAKAAAAGVTLPSISHNVAVIAPLAIALIAAALIALAPRLPRALAAAMLLALTLGGAAYFGYATPWRVVSGPASAMLEESPVVRALKTVAPPGSGRVLAADGWLGPLGVGPNQSMLFGLRNVSGYGPLLGLDYANATQLTNAGWIRPAAFDPQSRSLDVLATRWVFPHARTATSATPANQGIPWNGTPLGQAIGGGCAGTPIDSRATFRIPRDTKVKSIAMVTTLGCALEVPQDTVVAHAVLEGADPGKSLRVPIRAGVETAEWSAACKAAPGAEPQHRPASAFDSVPLPAIAPGCEGHHYVASLPAEGFEARALRFEWSLPPGVHPKALLQIKHVTLVGAEPAGTLALDRTDTTFADAARWKPHRLASGHDVYENLRARPYAWLVGAARQVDSRDRAIAVVGTGRYPDGRPFDPATSAVVVDPVRLPAPAAEAAPGPAGRAEVRRWDSGDVELAVEAPNPALLVISQRYYPGWSARVDGAPVPLLRVDGIVQGVEVPPGRHVVSLRFAPAYLPWLSFVAALALLGVVAALAFGRRSRKESWKDHGR